MEGNGVTEEERLGEVERLVERAVELRLEGAGFLAWFTAEEIAGRYNGLGPESFPAWIRDRASELRPVVLPAVLIHDLDYSCSDGTVGGWTYANERFLRNCRACVRAAHPWWSLWRYTGYVDARVLYTLASSPAGWTAWRDDFGRNEERRKLQAQLDEHNKKGTDK